MFAKRRKRKLEKERQELLKELIKAIELRDHTWKAQIKGKLTIIDAKIVKG